MSSETFDKASIGPTIDPADLRVPPHVGAHLAALFDADDRIETAAAWIDALRTTFDREADGSGEAPGDDAGARSSGPTADDLCRVTDGDHSVEIDGERQSFACVLDPLIVPFLRDEPGTVRSRSAVDDEAVTIEVGPSGATATPADAVVSLGVSHDVASDGELDPEGVYRRVCPYVQSFATPAEYERWAADVDAATTSLSVDRGVALARVLADELIE